MGRKMATLNLDCPEHGMFHVESSEIKLRNDISGKFGYNYQFVCPEDKGHVVDKPIHYLIAVLLSKYVEIDCYDSRVLGGDLAEHKQIGAALGEIDLDEEIDFGIIPPEQVMTIIEQESQPTPPL